MLLLYTVVSVIPWSTLMLFEISTNPTLTTRQLLGLGVFHYLLWTPSLALGACVAVAGLLLWGREWLLSLG